MAYLGFDTGEDLSSSNDLSSSGGGGGFWSDLLNFGKGIIGITQPSPTGYPGQPPVTYYPGSDMPPMYQSSAMPGWIIPAGLVLLFLAMRRK